MVSLTASIRAAARELGFAAAGVTTAEPLDEDRHRLEEWLGAGRHASMAWLARRSDARADPRASFPEARSVVAVALPHAAAPPDPVASPLPRACLARVARYAWGRDYHAEVRDRLRALEERIAVLSGRPFSGKSFVDTGPLLERALARRAGLGFVGRNTCLIVPSRGSFVSLGILVTDLELEPDTPAAHGCGDCRLCLEACPTGALVAPHVLDARRCLAYLTIEAREPVPRGLRDRVCRFAAGCDRCQEVCPHNQGPAAVDATAPVTRGLRPQIDLGWLLADSRRGAVEELIAGTALARSGRDRLVRNACLIAANRGLLELVPRIGRVLLEDPSESLRGQAAWALGRIGNAEALGLLDVARCRERSPLVLEEISRALGATVPGVTDHRTGVL